ncbi:CoA transferase [Kribbella sancticallisti]|uniref:CoA transferase n=1 Tax=Kribbella sancticallisti TaxID=460087 RepID=A0ABP4MWW1_9ACTN
MNTATRRDGAGPLSGYLVVDLSRALAGPHAAMMLGDLGARVIKVEPPGGGDDIRAWGPPFVGPEDRPQSTYFLAANRNKESIQLDLKDDADLRTLKRLIGRADVLVENYRPGVLDRLGLSGSVLETLNPRLVVLSITGFGHDGPEGSRAGYDQIAQGEAGLMSVTGPDADSPTRVGVPVGDILAGLNGAIGVLAALLERQLTDQGSVVRTSLLAGLVGAHAFHGTAWTVARQIGRAGGNHHPQISPYGAFRCRDGHVQVAIGSQTLWHTLASILRLDAADERFATNAARLRHRDELTKLIEQRLLTGSRDHWLELFTAAGIPAGALKTIDEVYAWAQTRSQNLVVSVRHAALGTIELPGPSLRLEDFGGHDIGRHTHEAPPLLGAHRDSILEWLESGPASTRR